MVLTLFGNIRIGEASVPGPESSPPHWHLGVCNPSGLLGKSHILASVEVDITAISETHLTNPSRRAFHQSLKATGKGFHSFLTGAPMAPRSDAQDVGAWAGVAFAGKHPCRALAVDWPPDLFESGRIQFCATYLRNFWLNGCVIYGYPAGVTHLHAHERTMAMLDFAFDHLSLQKVWVQDFSLEIGTLKHTRSRSGLVLKQPDGSKPKTYYIPSKVSNLSVLAKARPVKTSFGCHLS